MDTILRRLQTLTADHHDAVQQRTLGFFGSWKALDDDPVLLCECDDDDCAHTWDTDHLSRAGHRRS